MTDLHSKRSGVKFMANRNNKSYAMFNMTDQMLYMYFTYAKFYYKTISSV